MRLIRTQWPDFGQSALPPPLDADTLRDRMARTRIAMAARGLAALVVYADREHAANIQWLTGFDPRYEEAVFILTADAATLLVGNECLSYTRISATVVAGDVVAILVPSLSLLGQPRGGRRIADALADHVPAGSHVGAAGWKYFGPDEVDDPATALDLPAFLADPLRAIARRVENATDLLMHPGHGLRARVDVDQIVRLEFANDMAARAVRRMVAAFRDGMTDFDAVQAAGIGGLPLGCHPSFATGIPAELGMSGPSGQVLRRGQTISFNICHWGSNICRAGWLARDAGDLPVAAQDYVAAFAGPYVAAMSEWCALMRPGVPGGQLWDRIMTLLPPERFGITLNPGHLIGQEEWLSSPIMAGSDIAMASGMALQMDVIPAHADYGSTRMEDGYVIADDALRAGLARDYPAVAARCAQRQAFMRDVIGMDVPDCLLPLADTCGIVAPFLLDSEQVIALN